ncbi:MAG: hypothetical protein EXS09_02495 [Gemmataceae bacterium]|nr:hypothetical protein [Gemmataceae bacterium]
MVDPRPGIRTELVELARELLDGRPLRRARRYWGGADVVITRKKPEPRNDNWYPDPRYVVTRFAIQLSGLFEVLRDIFMPAIDSMSKIEFYGRLANAADRYLTSVDAANQTARDLVFAAATEAFVMLEEMDSGTFGCLAIATGNAILDDLAVEAERSSCFKPEVIRQRLEDLVNPPGDP